MDENTATQRIPGETPWDPPPPPPPPAIPLGWPPAAAPRPPRRRWPLMVALLIVVLAVASLVVLLALAGAGFIDYGSGDGSPLSGYAEQIVEKGSGKSRILLIDIDGPIASSEGCGPLALAALRRLRREGKPENVATVLLRVNSPGGTVTCCDSIDSEIRRCMETTVKCDGQDRPIRFVAFYDELSASGGYYVSARAGHIVARPTCVVGSIGVIGLSINAERLLRDKLGLEAQAIKSVPFKDVPSLFRPMTDVEHDYMQKMIMDMHQRFRGVVRDGRRLTEEQVDAFANGKVFLAEEALRLGMIDSVGEWDDAADKAREAAHNLQASIITYRRRPSPLEALLQARAEPALVPDDLRLMLQTAARGRFCYLWLP